MSREVDDRIRDALEARAATTTTSADAWARVERKAARAEHRRSLALKLAAAAAVLLVLVVAGVSVLRDDDSGTVATSRVAEDSAATGSRAGGAERAVPPSVTAVAGPIEILVYPDGSVAARVGATTTPPVRPGALSAAVADGTVFGIAPATAGSVEISADAAPGVTRAAIADLVPASGEIRSFAVDGFDGVTGGIRVQAGGASVVLPGGAR